MDPELAQLLLTYLQNQQGSETSGSGEQEKYTKYAQLISNGMGALNSMGDYWAAQARREGMIEDIQRQNELEASYADRALGQGQGGGGSQHVEEPSLVQALLGAGRYVAQGAIGLINKPNSTTPEHGPAEINEDNNFAQEGTDKVGNENSLYFKNTGYEAEPSNPLIKQTIKQEPIKKLQLNIKGTPSNYPSSYIYEEAPVTPDSLGGWFMT